MFIPFLLTIINASKTHQIWYHSHVCSSETINIKQLTFQAENKLVNILLSHFPPLPKCNSSFSPLKPSSGEAFSSCIGFSIGFLNFGSSHLVLVILQDLFKRLLRFCYKNSLGGILSSFKELSLSTSSKRVQLLLFSRPEPVHDRDSSYFGGGSSSSSSNVSTTWGRLASNSRER